ncbi:MAG: hypothetical protein R3E77_10275 [Steroidobacteraceae bacterium]
MTRVPSAAIATEGIDPAEVIGRPFPLSASIQRSCAEIYHDTCTPIFERLDRFQNEPRDPEWASRIEDRLRQLVGTVAAGQATVRQVECRTTLCAMEVEWRYKNMMLDTWQDEVLRREVLETGAIVGFENSNSEEKLQVTFEVYFRRLSP